MAEKCPFCNVPLVASDPPNPHWWHCTATDCPLGDSEIPLMGWQAIHALKADNERLREALEYVLENQPYMAVRTVDVCKKVRQTLGGNDGSNK